MSSGRALRRAGAAALLIGIAALAVAFSLDEYRRVASPDGRFHAVAEFRRYAALIPMFPGGGGDKPGFVTVYTREGVSCGRVEVPMVQHVHQLTWGADVAEIRRVARWDLARCSVATAS